MRDLKDRTCSWLLDRHPAALLLASGEHHLGACQSLRCVVTAPKKIPDGLMVATYTDGRPPRDFLIEVASYPEEAVADQVLEDLCLVKLIRSQLPEVVVLVLLERGNQSVPASWQQASPGGTTTLGGAWRVVQLCDVPAAPVLAGPDVGALPLAPLMKFTEPPAVVVQQVKDRIEAEAPAAERENLLAVAQVLTTARFTDQALVAILGGKQAMLISPLLQEIVDERCQQTAHRLILRALEKRFGPVASELSAAVRLITEEAALDALMDLACSCPDLATFRAHLGL